MPKPGQNPRLGSALPRTKWPGRQIWGHAVSVLIARGGGVSRLRESIWLQARQLSLHRIELLDLRDGTRNAIFGQLGALD